MAVKLLLVAWCSASLLAGGGLVIWFAVEMKLFGHWLHDRLRARRAQARLPKARALIRTSAGNSHSGSTSTPHQHHEPSRSRPKDSL
jgi:hypothetical protein